jgi:tetratricopeptide (TPR) repeat protein
LSVDVYPGKPGFEEAQWIMSEDVNVEHLLDVFTSIDANSVDVWDACAYFMRHLYWHKPRLVVLGPKIEGLPDDHPSKPQCLFQLSWLFDSVGNHVERKRLLVHALKLWRERGDEAQSLESPRSVVARVTTSSMPQKKPHPERSISSRTKAINFRVCQCHRLLGDIHYSKGETEKAIDHFETALGIASSFNWHDQLFWIHISRRKWKSRVHLANRISTVSSRNRYHFLRLLTLHSQFGAPGTIS